jgi:hypothetical protein
VGEAMMVDLGPLSHDIDLATGKSRTCQHLEAVPVELLEGGELVAWLCPACDEQLPPEPDPRHAAMVRLVVTGAISPDEARRMQGHD